MKFLKAALMSAIIAISGGGLFTLSVESASAATRNQCYTYWSHGVRHRSCNRVKAGTRCRTYWRHGVKHRSCGKAYSYRKVCRTYWRNGVKHRNCRNVRR